MQRYNPKEIEPKWQKVWAESGIYAASEDPSKPKRYVLEYFPYPSGAAMHVGHVRNYTIGDALARFYRMRGYNVMHPMGWDAFGLPAENYAIKNNISPQQAIAENTAKFKAQLSQMGFSYDWSREINSSDPRYYRWTQWFFKLLFERGLAYQKDSLQWWCETDKTVLANEQVEAGKCWRCGNAVIKKPLKQWFFKITEYADRLVEDLEDLDWTESIKSMQRNWIGKSKGAEVTFQIAHDEVRSFIMGQKDISVQDIEALDGRVVRTTTEGYLCAVVPASKVADFEALIVAKMQPGFWNEYIGDETVFIFKDTQGNTCRFVWTAETESEILSLCQSYAGLEFSSIASMLAGNDWYKELFSNSETNDPMSITVFTTRPDTLFGATFMVLAPEHPLVAEITTKEHKAEVEKYVKTAQSKSDLERQEQDREKTGVFTGAYAINPVNGEHIPIWVADFVLAGYGTGAVFADACDERDFAFAKKFNIPLKPTVIPEHDAVEAEKVMNLTHAFTGEGILVNSGVYNGMRTSLAREKIVAELVASGAAREVVNYKIRDWLISRQRYWGAPIPIVHCSTHGAVAVPDDQLPVELPIVTSYQPTGEGTSVLASVKDWVNTTCPKCGGPAKRETDTMDGFACSSWYFLRFADPNNEKEPFSAEKAKFWLPVDDYIGGAEHAVMHLLYARMWTKVFHDAGLIDFDEPFSALRNHGMILAPDGRKMSKSWGNVIAPDDIIAQGYGADAIRIMELFIGPWNQAANWSVEGMGGCYRFLQRGWTLVQEYLVSQDLGTKSHDETSTLMRKAHRTIHKVSKDLEDMGFNTAIATLMEYVNELYKCKAEHGFADRTAWQFALETFMLLLAPFAPHITEELWQQLGHKESVHTAPWPVHDEAYLVDATMTIAVQVNGKLRATIIVPTESGQAAIVAHAKAHENIATHLAGEPTRVIYVPGKLLNLVS